MAPQEQTEVPITHDTMRSGTRRTRLVAIALVVATVTVVAVPMALAYIQSNDPFTARINHAYVAKSYGHGPLPNTYSTGSLYVEWRSVAAKCLPGENVYGVRVTGPITIDAMRVCTFVPDPLTVERTSHNAAAFGRLDRAAAEKDSVPLPQNFGCATVELIGPSWFARSHGYWLSISGPQTACGTSGEFVKAAMDVARVAVGGHLQPAGRQIFSAGN
jgi:hypothetical protein